MSGVLKGHYSDVRLIECMKWTGWFPLVIKWLCSQLQKHFFKYLLLFADALRHEEAKRWQTWFQQLHRAGPHHPPVCGCSGLVSEQLLESTFRSLGLTLRFDSVALGLLLLSRLLFRGRAGLLHRGGQVRLGRRGTGLRLRLGGRRRRLGEEAEQRALLRHVCESVCCVVAERRTWAPCPPRTPAPPHPGYTELGSRETRAGSFRQWRAKWEVTWSTWLPLAPRGYLFFLLNNFINSTEAPDYPVKILISCKRERKNYVTI